MSRDVQDTHWHTTIDSPIGPLGLAATDRGLRAVSWRGDETSVELPSDMLDGSDHPVLARQPRSSPSTSAGTAPASTSPSICAAPTSR